MSTMPQIAMPAQPLVFQDAFADMLAGYMAAADLLGRLHVLQRLQAKTGNVPKMNTLTSITFADVLGFESVPPKGAIERIRNLTSYTRQAFDALKAKYKRGAFTVAGVQDVGLIERMQKALGDVLQQGGTERDFRNAVDQLTSDAGVEQLSGRHLETVFQTNIQRAYQDGHFEQMRDSAVTAALPYWQYVTAGDFRVRPAHAALDGFVARYDDTIWNRIYPPTGYNCRCSVIAIGPEDAPEDADVPGSQRIPPEAANVPDPGFGGRF